MSSYWERQPRWTPLSAPQLADQFCNRPDVIRNPASIAGVTRSVLCTRQKL